MVGATPEEIDGYTGQRIFCDGISNGDLCWHVCHFGRIYNNVTGLKKSLRQHLTANNHSLVCCDVSNSQPLLVGLLCRRTENELLRNNLCNKFYSLQFDHYLELDQEFLDRISPSFPQKQEEEWGIGDGNSLYDGVLTKSSQFYIVPQKQQEERGLGEDNSHYDVVLTKSSKLVPGDRNT